MTVKLLTVPVLESGDDPRMWMYEAYRDVHAAARFALRGNTDTLNPAESLRLARLRDEASESVWLLAVDGDDSRHVLGAGSASWMLLSNPTLAFLDVAVYPEHRRRGVGALLADTVESVADEHGRTSKITWIGFAEPKDGEATAAAQNGDAVPADTPGLIMATKRGYTLRLVNRQSRLDLPVDAGLLDRLWRVAEPKAAGYRLRQWVGVPDEKWLDQIAALSASTAVEQPVGDVDWEEDPWDGDRLREYIQRLGESGRDAVTTVAEHIATGEIVAETDFDVTRQGRADAEQGDTIVRRDHRGHNLGMTVKIANLRRLMRDYPQIERVYTWNTSINEHMLAINTALGFYPAGGEAVMQKGD